MSDQPASELISLPQGGGAVRGLGEAFAPDLHTGTGNLKVPLDVPSGRPGVQPQLALAYSTGNPNGPFGLGWSLDVPGVRRKTAKCLPRYDAGDVFVLSGAEDLVPVPGGAPRSRRYRPRSEGLFAHIVRHTGDGQDYWEVRGGNGLRSRYGTVRPADAAPDWRDPAAIADPARPARVLGWLLTETADPMGNRIAYRYLRDGGQLYLREVAYVDLDEPGDPDPPFLVAIRLAYGNRPDPFTDRRGGFPVQTRLRCRRIETFVHGDLVRSVQLRYADEDGRGPANGCSLLGRIQVTGHAGEETESLPPLELGYTDWAPERRRYRALTAPGDAMPAESLGRGGRDLVDLFGDGLPSVLELGPAPRYWRNRGDGQFDPPRRLRAVPDGVVLGNGGSQLADMDGDGRTDLLVADGDRAGYFPLGHDGGFDSTGAVTYTAVPSVDLGDPELRLVDLDGDGVVDALRAGERMETYLHDRRRGWTLAATGADGPPVSFADPRVKLADMTGDGLTDIVLVTSRRVTYWPNLGHGRWGAAVEMAAAPASPDGPDGFQPERVLLGDVDGDGCADLVYVGAGYVTVWVNQAGVRFGPPQVVRGTPEAGHAGSVRLADMLGTGTAGVLWTFDAGTQRGSTYKFLDLTGGAKPYLLRTVDNHMGARTAIAYASSTEYAVADAHSGRPWRTTLPFPVQVVARITVTDHFSRSSLTTAYRYHHGHWDGAEREFRGFGRVDQLDAQEFSGDAGESPAHHSPPLETRTWFHLGPVGPELGAWRTVDLSPEYWRGDPRGVAPSDVSALPAQLPRRGLRDAVRALAGRILRTELYALDGDPAAERPYTVSEHGYAVVPVLDGRETADESWSARPVIAVHAVAGRTTQWERGDDPMISWSFTGGHDSYGRPGHTVAVAVPRRHDPAASREPYLATITRTRYATRDDDVLYRTDRAARVARHEIVNDGGGTPAELRDRALAGELELGVRALELHHYDGEAFTGLPVGELGAHGLLTRSEQLAVTPELLTDVFGDAPAPYLTGAPASWPAEYPAEFRVMMAGGAGYAWHAGDKLYEPGYYVEAERVRYDLHDGPAGRGLVVAKRDPLGGTTTISYDAHRLLAVETVDPAGLRRRAEYDYRTFQPRLLTDPNGDRTVGGYTPLGMLSWFARIGRPGAEEGDTAEQPAVRYDYAFNAWADAGQPTSAHITTRVDQRWSLVHAERERRSRAGLPAPDDEDIAALFTDEPPERFLQERRYWDGFGRPLQVRSQFDSLSVDAGLPLDGAVPGDAFASENLDVDAPTVAVTGSTAYDNKGRVVQATEPYLGSGWAFRVPESERQGSNPARTVTRYDARGSVVLVTHPDAAQTRTVHGRPFDLREPSRAAPTPWEVHTYDQNDNGGRTHSMPSDAWKDHWDTPQSAVVDALGRVVETARRTATETRRTSTTFDIDGHALAVRDELDRVVATTTFDLLGRPWRQALLDAGVTLTVHDAQGGVVERLDGKAARTLVAYDARRRLVRRWARDGAGRALTLRELTVYGDSPEAGITREEAAGARLLDHPYVAYDESGRVEMRRYDLLGNLRHTVRRVLRTAVLLSGLPAQPGDWSNRGAIVDWTPPSGRSLAEHAETLLDPERFETESRFDGLARRTSLLCPLDVEGRRRELRFTYARSGALAALSVDGRPFIQRICHDARGQRALVLYGNGVMSRYAYDTRTGRLARLRTEGFREPSRLRWSGTGTVLQDHRYRYDLVGNLLTLFDRSPGCGVSPGPADALDRHFAYDPLYRLVSAGGREHAIAPPEPWSAAPRGVDLAQVRPYTQRYEHDAAGNIIALAHSAGTGSFRRSFTLVPDSNRVASVGFGSLAAAYTYDDCGNVTREGSARHLEWDAANRLTAFRTQVGTAEPSLWAHYRYSASGGRVIKLVRNQGGGVTRTVSVEGVFDHVTVVKPTGTTSCNVLHVGEASARSARIRIGPALPGDDSPAVVYHHNDHLGSVAVTTDEDGSVYSREEYFPFGETSFGGYAGKRHRFTGTERDDESGLGHHGARYYAPWLVRWTSPDPAGLVDGPNLYAYGRGSPLRLTDTAGTQAREVPKGIQDYSDSAIVAEARQTGSPLAIAKAILYGLTMYFSPRQTASGRDYTSDELAAMEGRSLKMSTGAVLGLGQNTTKALIGDDIPAAKIREEMPGNALVLLGPVMRGKGLFQALKAESSRFRGWNAAHEGYKATYWNAITDANGAPVSAAETVGLSSATEAMAWRNWKLSPTQFKYSQNRGLDLHFEGVGENLGFAAFCEAKASGGLGRLSTPKTTELIGGLRQGGEGYIGMSLATYVERGGTEVLEAERLMMQLRMGNVKSFAASSDGLWELTFFGNPDFRRQAWSARLLTETP